MTWSEGSTPFSSNINKSELPKLIGLLGGKPDDDILDVLEESWTGPRAADLEALLRESDVEVERFVWSG